MIRRLIILFLLLPLALKAAGQTRYVTDEFEIMMRTGPSVKNKIVKTLTSGTKVIVLQEDAGDGYSQIQIESGDTGYALVRYLDLEPSARDQVASLKSQIDQLRSEPENLASILAASQEDNALLITQNTELTDRIKMVEAELARIKKVSGDAVNIANQNERLKDEVHQLVLERDDERIQKESLKDQSDQMNKIIGGSFVFLGLVLGWILSISGRRRRNSWGS